MLVSRFAGLIRRILMKSAPRASSDPVRKKKWDTVAAGSVEQESAPDCNTALLREKYRQQRIELSDRGYNFMS